MIGAFENLIMVKLCRRGPCHHGQIPNTFCERLDDKKRKYGVLTSKGFGLILCIMQTECNGGGEPALPRQEESACTAQTKIAMNVSRRATKVDIVNISKGRQGFEALFIVVYSLIVSTAVLNSLFIRWAVIVKSRAPTL